MSSKNKHPREQQIELNDDGTEVLKNIESKYSANKTIINAIVIGAIVVVGGIFAYFQLYKAPKEDKALTALGSIQTLLAVDSFNLALNGDASTMGLLKLISKYDGTKAANLAHYYAGNIYLEKGEFDNAIKHLSEFDGDNTNLADLAYGNLGDAYLEKGDKEKAAEYYKKATKNINNDLVAPVYLYRLGVVCEMLNKNEDAIKAYQTLKSDFPTSSSARDVDLRLAKLGILD